MTEQEFEALCEMSNNLKNLNDIIEEAFKYGTHLHFELEYWDTHQERTCYKRLKIPTDIKEELRNYIKKRLIVQRDKLKEKFENVKIVL